MRHAPAADPRWSADPHPEDRFIGDFLRRAGPCSRRDRDIALALCQSLFDLCGGLAPRAGAVGVKALLEDAGLTQCLRARELAARLCSRSPRVRRSVRGCRPGEVRGERSNAAAHAA